MPSQLGVKLGSPQRRSARQLSGGRLGPADLELLASQLVGPQPGDGVGVGEVSELLEHQAEIASGRRSYLCLGGDLRRVLAEMDDLR